MDVTPDGAVIEGVRVELLGGLAITDGTRRQDLGSTTRRGLVLSLLASRCNERVPIDDLADAVWPTGVPSTFRKSLQVAVHGLRDLIAPQRRAETTPRSPIVGHPGAYELRLPPERIDAVRFEALVRTGHRLLAERRTTEAAASLDGALRMWAEPFPGADREMLRPYSERLHRSYREAKTASIEAHLQLGTEDLTEIEQAVALDPFDERRWGYLMIALFRRGRQADALAAYARARRILIDELGIEPGQYLRRVESQVLLQDPVLLGEVAEEPPSAVEWSPIPHRSGPLLSRSDDVRAIETQLSTWRLVTLVGPPGVGKTSVAAEVARRLGRPTGWLSLGDVGPGPGATIDISRRLGVASETFADAGAFRRLLAARIGDRELLLVLDNAEHLLTDVADLQDELLRTCPNLTILVTSRRPLGVAMERVHRIRPFDDDGIGYLVERSGIDDSEPATRAALRRICEHLGGIALGLEQAALRLATIHPGELADRLELIDVRTSPMYAAVSWSIDLLDRPAVRLLSALAILDAPWSAARAEALGAQTGLDRVTVRQALTTLANHSLVVDAPGTSAPAHRIIEPVRQYLRSAADEEATTIAARACAAVVLDEVVVAARGIEGADQRGGMASIRSMMPDIRRTVQWCVDADEPAIAARILGELRGWWWASGMYAEGQELHHAAEPLLEAWSPEGAQDKAWRLRALSSRVVAEPGFGPPAAYARRLEGWLEEADNAGLDPSVTGWIAQLLSAGLTFTNRDSPRAEALAIRSIEDAGRSGDAWLAAWGRYALAVARGRVDPAEALTQLEQAIAGFLAAGDRLNAARATMFLGHGSRIFGDPRSSADAFQRAKPTCTPTCSTPPMCRCAGS